MLDLMKPHVYRAGKHRKCFDSAPKPEDPEDSPQALRKHIEPWLTAVFQSEHLSLLLGSGFTAGIASAAGAEPASMGKHKLGATLGDLVDMQADASAADLERGTPNVEDQIRALDQLRDGLQVLLHDEKAHIQLGKGEPLPATAAAVEVADMRDRILTDFARHILATERAVLGAQGERRPRVDLLLESFLMSFASRTASRERLNVFTTNYDRLVEYGCDLAGLRTIDRFVGSLAPVFRSSRLNIDIHYNPPGIRGEPRYLEGVIRLTKLHGSLDWRWDKRMKGMAGEIRRCALPFGANDDHPGVSLASPGSVMIYPNPAKDTETLAYPYAELFRDFAAGLCCPNSALVTYGYGFGDDHINRIIRDMLTIPSTHLVIIAWSPESSSADDAARSRIRCFCKSVGQAQVSLLLGEHFGDINALADHYLPKPAIDPITERQQKLKERRGDDHLRQASDDSTADVVRDKEPPV